MRIPRPSSDLPRQPLRRLAGVAFLLLLALGGSVAAAQDSTVRLTSRSGSRVQLDGSTTIRAAWRCSADAPDASMELDARRAEAADALSAALGDGTERVRGRAVRRISLRVPVRDLDCGNPMAGRALRKALKTQDVVGVFQVVEGTSRSHGARVAGLLTVAGVTREVTFDVATEWRDDGTVRATGRLPLTLSSFGIEPPRVLLSSIRANDALTVSFDLLLGIAPPERGDFVAQR